MARSEGSRPTRVAGAIQAELASLLMRGIVRDPRARDVVITHVSITSDLQSVRVYVRKLGEVSLAEAEGAVIALTRASGFLRRELAPAITIRRVPELSFEWDESIDRAQRMESILAELREPDSGDESDEGR
ncbi:MAG: 30S ribosome-binding factor RbfA [Myxococcales bacterium]|nr:30S ribosome-binding factor RbfA [Myxococcales bacterium]